MEPPSAARRNDVDTDERVAQNRRRSQKGYPQRCPGGLSAAAGQCGAVAAEGEHGQGDECFWGAESERDAGQ